MELDNWTLITVSYNSENQLRNFWNKKTSESIAEWIVVDNASSDESAKVARTLGARVIELPANVGFAAGNNIGAELVNTEYIAFVNPDVAVNTEDLKHFESLLNDDPRQLLAPQLVNVDGSPQPNGRSYPYLSHKILNRLAPKLVEGKYTLYANEVNPLTVQWITGAVVITKTKTFFEIGKWNESFFVYYEDTELCLRAKSQGVVSKVIGNINWTHDWARSASGTNWHAWKLELTSARKFYRKYPRYLLATFAK